MAKNVKQKKKRIAHNKNDLLDCLIDSQQAALGSDLVAQIMSDMNSNLISNNLSALADSSFNQKSITQKQHVVGASQNQTQSTFIYTAKRKLGLDKKFPLMEKSQRVLKHLKHNRKVPKPRAHLASLGPLPVCDNTKSETKKKVGNNIRKTAPSPSKSTATNKTSVKRNNVKLSETAVKLGNISRKISPSQPVTSNKTSTACGSSKKSEIGKKVGNISKKASPYESVTTYQISPWLNNYSEESRREESKVKNKRSETVVLNNYSKRDDSSSVSDINEEIRNVFGESETSDGEFEKFVQSQTKGKKMKKRCKKQPTTGRKKTQQKSSTQKQKNAKKNVEVRYSSEYESDCDAKSKSCKKINERPKAKSRKKSSKKNNTLSEDECESEFDNNNDKLRRKSGKNNTPLLEDESESESELNFKSRKKSSKINTTLSEDECESEFDNDKLRRKSGKNNTPLLEEESESESELNFKSRKKRSKINTPLSEDESVSDFGLNEDSRKESEENNTPFPEDEHDSVFDDFGDNDVYTRNSSSDDETVINIPITPTVPKRMNEHILMSELNSFDVTDSLDSNGLSESNPNLNIYSSGFTQKRSNGQVLTSKVNALGSKHNFVSDELCSTSSNAFTDISHAIHSAQESSENLMVIDLSSSDDECESANQFISTDKSVVRETVPNASKSQSDDESDLEIVDVIVPDEILKNVTEGSNQSVNISTNVINIKIEKQPDKVTEKHEPVFSTDICSKPFEADSESTSLDHRVNDITINKVIKQEKCDDDIFVLCDEKVSVELSNSSQTFSNGRANIKTTVIGETSTCKKEHPLENEAGGAEGMISREKRLFEIACSKLKNPIPDDKSIKFSSLSPGDMKSMDVKTILQLFKNEFQTYQEIIETQESIGHTFKLLESRQAEKLLLLKSALKTYVGSVDGSGLNTSMVDIEKIQASASRLLENNPGTSSLNTNTVSNAKDVKSLHLRGPRDFSQISLVPLSSIQQKDIKPDVSKLQNILDSDQKYKVPSNEMSFGQKCVVCSKDAIAACQQCCKVFFCSDNCGITYWDAGHASSCSK